MFFMPDSAILDILGCMVYQWYVSYSESHRQKIFWIPKLFIGSWILNLKDGWWGGQSLSSLDISMLFESLGWVQARKMIYYCKFKYKKKYTKN